MYCQSHRAGAQKNGQGMIDRSRLCKGFTGVGEWQEVAIICMLVRRLILFLNYEKNLSVVALGCSLRGKCL